MMMLLARPIHFSKYRHTVQLRRTCSHRDVPVPSSLPCHFVSCEPEMTIEKLNMQNERSWPFGRCTNKHKIDKSYNSCVMRFTFSPLFWPLSPSRKAKGLPVCNFSFCTFQYRPLPLSGQLHRGASFVPPSCRSPLPPPSSSSRLFDCGRICALSIE